MRIACIRSIRPDGYSFGRRILKLLHCHLIFLFVLSLGACSGADESAAVGTAQAGNVDENFFVYSKRFASRFNLPEEGIEDLSAGLEAIAVNVTYDQQVAALPMCSFKLFLDSDLPLKWPDNPTGYVKLYHPGEFGAFFLDKLPGAEHQWVRKHRNPIYADTAYYRTRDREGLYATANLFQYDREYFEGLSYLWLVTLFACEVVEGENAPFEILLKKDGTEEGEFPAWESESIRIAVPDRIISAAEKFAKATESSISDKSIRYKKDQTFSNFKIP